VEANMAIAIKVPDVGAADDSVSVVNWLVQVGDQVVRGQKIVSLETDKAVIDLESVASGAILKLCVAAGEDAVVGDVLAYVGVVGELASESGPHRQDGNEADGRQKTSTGLLVVAMTRLHRAHRRYEIWRVI
jgi:pyruvate/2-oxoglutarate dehydrogenase complex dihydrolipoamide acyltransferase (E2) component